MPSAPATSRSGYRWVECDWEEVWEWVWDAGEEKGEGVAVAEGKAVVLAPEEPMGQVNCDHCRRGIGWADVWKSQQGWKKGGV
jgi:hypothetical protein